MEKTKFIVKGMHCTSCATLIEQKLKEQASIISAKVNYDSQKAVIVFDEQKINKAEFAPLIKSIGDYQIEEITGDEETTETLKEKIDAPMPPTTLPGQSAKNSFFLGLLTGISIISLITNLILGISLYRIKNNNTALAKSNSPANQAVNINSNKQQQNNPSAPPTIQSFQITKKNHVRGDFNAPITLVEFSDFECPFCGRAYPTFKKILNDYPSQVRLVYKHFPLSNLHPNSQKAAEASECSDEQGKFWEYHDKLFENQSSGFSVDKFKQWAVDLNLNSTQFNNCLDSGKYTQKVQSDYQEGSTKGVQGTPATFVNGQLVSGALPYENFKQIIDSLI